MASGVWVAATLLSAPAANGAEPEALSPAARQWWADISVIADDDTEGRLTGSPGYDRAAAYVVSRFKAEGLAPAGVNGYAQPVAFERQVIDQAASTAGLVAGDGEATPLRVGEDMLIAAGGAPRPPRVDAPMVFVGYGLHLPNQGYDDFAGVDLRGRIAVVLGGGPADISGPVKSAARFARAELLTKLGAVGLITLTTPHPIEIPWARQKLLAGQPGMYLADPQLRDAPDGFFSAAIDPEQAERLFGGSGHSFSELCALSDASKALPRFPC